jgi:hypothetical protein
VEVIFDKGDGVMEGSGVWLGINVGVGGKTGVTSRQDPRIRNMIIAMENSRVCLHTFIGNRISNSQCSYNCLKASFFMAVFVQKNRPGFW